VNTTFLAMSISILIGVGLLVGIGALSLVSGALNFLFVKPKLVILKSQFGDSGFAFTFAWDQSAEPVKYDQFRIQLYNPFGSPTQLDITREFEGSSEDFARDIEMGPKFKEIISAKGLENATVELQIFSSKDSVTHNISMKGAKFKQLVKSAKLKIDDVSERFVTKKDHRKYEVPERTFISPPLPKSNRYLKIATNPEFAGQFSGAAGGESAGSTVSNFSVSKIWIEPGCIVCDACEGIYPEVFEVTDSSCIIRPGAPLNDGLKVQEAAEACPVEVIKFTKVG
jgi:ferredoxin